MKLTLLNTYMWKLFSVNVRYGITRVKLLIEHIQFGAKTERPRTSFVSWNTWGQSCFLQLQLFWGARYVVGCGRPPLLLPMLHPRWSRFYIWQWPIFLWGENKIIHFRLYFNLNKIIPYNNCFFVLFNFLVGYVAKCPILFVGNIW